MRHFFLCIVYVGGALLFQPMPIYSPGRCLVFCWLLFSLAPGLSERGRAGADKGADDKPVTIAGHPAKFDAAGRLLPWIAWRTALDREMRFYEGAPMEHGYPVFVTTTFLDVGW